MIKGGPRYFFFKVPSLVVFSYVGGGFEVVCFTWTRSFVCWSQMELSGWCYEGWIIAGLLCSLRTRPWIFLRRWHCPLRVSFWRMSENQDVVVIFSSSSHVEDPRDRSKMTSSLFFGFFLLANRTNLDRFLNLCFYSTFSLVIGNNEFEESLLKVLAESNWKTKISSFFKGPVELYCRYKTGGCLRGVSVLIFAA